MLKTLNNFISQLRPSLIIVNTSMYKWLFVVLIVLDFLVWLANWNLLKANLDPKNMKPNFFGNLNMHHTQWILKLLPTS